MNVLQVFTTLLWVIEQASFFYFLITLVVVAISAIKLGVEITTEGWVFGFLEGVLRDVQWLWLLPVVAPVLVLGKGLDEGGGAGKIVSLEAVGD